MDKDIYRRPPMSFGDKLRETISGVENRVTKNLLAATYSDNVTDLLVKLMYGASFQDRLKDMKLEAHELHVLELAEAVEQIRWYGNFRGPALACQLQYLYHKGYLAHARFGRENSPVVYLKPTYTYSPYPPSKHEEMKEEILKSLRRLHPRELEETHDFWLRARWD